MKAERKARLKKRQQEQIEGLTERQQELRQLIALYCHDHDGMTLRMLLEEMEMIRQNLTILTE